MGYGNETAIQPGVQARGRLPAPSCLLIEVDLPDGNGLDLQRRVAEERHGLPIIFVTRRTDIPISVRAMKAGAIEFLTKPVDRSALMAAIQEGLERSEATLINRSLHRSLGERYAMLTCRERQVMSLVVARRLNKRVAWELSISETTVKPHRGRAPSRRADGRRGRRFFVALLQEQHARRSADAARTAACEMPMSFSSRASSRAICSRSSRRCAASRRRQARRRRDAAIAANRGN